MGRSTRRSALDETGPAKAESPRPWNDPADGSVRQKFPNSPLLLAELRHVERTGDAGVRAHLVTTLEQAMRVGVRDHLAGTFHRYAVDRRWHVPHFERMLYDNAQLAQVYVEAGRALDRPDFVAVGRAVLDDLIERWPLRAAAPQAVQRPFRSGFFCSSRSTTPSVRRARWSSPATRPTNGRDRCGRSCAPPFRRACCPRASAHRARRAILPSDPALANERAIDGEATAYVCQIGSCELPTNDPAVLTAQLREAGVAPAR